MTKKTRAESALKRATRESARHAGIDIKGARVAVQGFGNVGSVSAQLLSDIGAKIVAVTDWKGGVYRPDGLDLSKLSEHVRQHKTVDGFPGADEIDNEQLFTLEVDVLIPAALENQITIENASSINAKIVVEGANGPTTPPADTILAENGVFVIPDILANAGGVTVSYFEWVQDRQGYFWNEQLVNSRLEEIMVDSFRDVVSYAEKHGVHNRTAAYMLALDRVAFAIKLRGIYA